MPTLQRPRRSYLVELAQFHSPEYLEFLQRISPEEQEVQDCTWAPESEEAWSSLANRMHPLTVADTASDIHASV